MDGKTMRRAAWIALASLSIALALVLWGVAHGQRGFAVWLASAMICLGSTCATYLFVLSNHSQPMTKDVAERPNGYDIEGRMRTGGTMFNGTCKYEG